MDGPENPRVRRTPLWTTGYTTDTRYKYNDYYLPHKTMDYHAKIDGSIPLFNSLIEDEDPILWLELFEQGARRNGWLEYEKLAKVSLYLEGHAALWFYDVEDWIQTWRESDDFGHYSTNSFYGKFYAKFITPSIERLWLEQFRYCTFVKNDSVTTFAKRLSEIHKRCTLYLNVSDAELIDQFKQNLSGVIREKLLRHLDFMEREYQIRQYSFDTIVKITQRVELNHINEYGSLPYDYSCEQIDHEPYHCHYAKSIYMREWIYTSVYQIRHKVQPKLTACQPTVHIVNKCPPNQTASDKVIDTKQQKDIVEYEGTSNINSSTTSYDLQVDSTIVDKIQQRVISCNNYIELVNNNVDKFDEIKLNATKLVRLKRNAENININYILHSNNLPLLSAFDNYNYGIFMLDNRGKGSAKPYEELPLSNLKHSLCYGQCEDAFSCGAGECY
ncbi:hypothetical protein BDF19DRAFT_438650 [Syncephalis fuscata]|nr:hypothetical protein BDF19DRAFT_438650 [Syncephalis fuscata]